ncbi:MAG: helix-turn-helix transcriptional regulator [Candidatus Saccharibacteria bacterium]|nr:helix-turn-helix transcriptional regulator [Candidatus Saccharibacteria bacterium]
MDLEKIGKFIAKKRQENGFTQESLAEKLDISNRSISKWERGICLPDANNMAKLCQLFNVSYNELLSGAEISQKDYKKYSEKLLEEFSKIETAINKKFFLYENVIGYMATVPFLILCFIAGYVEMPTWTRITLITLGFILIMFGVSFCIKIEAEAGKYECKHCGHRYVPKYSSVFLAPHFGRTRKMVCPKCHKKSWQKKII